MTSRGNAAIFDRVGAVGVPVLVVRARRAPSDAAMADFRYSPTWAGLAGAFRHGRDRYLEHGTHFLPMEDVALAARLILEDEGGG